MTRTLTSLTLLLLVAIASPARANVTVALRDRAILRGERYIRLDEIAAIKGEDEAARRVARVFVGPAPKQGRETCITRRDIRQRLSEQGLVDIIAFAGAQAVVVRSEEVHTDSGDNNTGKSEAVIPVARTLSERETAELIRACVAKHVLTLVPGKDLSAEVTVSRLKGNATTATSILKVSDIESGRLPGRGRVSFSALDAKGRATGTLEAYIDAKVKAPVAVLRRQLSQGEIVTPADVLVQRQTIDAEKAYMPLEKKLIVGQAAAHSLRQGAPLMVGDLTEPLAVRKGQLVRVDTVRGGFRIRAHAKALADGRVGDLIEVENLAAASRKIYPVRVTGANTVAVALPGGE